MEKTYTKTGYSYVTNDGKTVEVSKAMVQKAIADQIKLHDNIETNLENLNADLVAINNA